MMRSKANNAGSGALFSYFLSVRGWLLHLYHTPKRNVPNSHFFFSISMIKSGPTVPARKKYLVNFFCGASKILS